MEIERVVELIRRKQENEGAKWLKRGRIETLAILDGIPRKDLRRTCKAAQEGEIEDQLRYVRFGHESYYYTPKTKYRLPERVRKRATKQEGRRFEKDAESDGLKDLILGQLDIAFDAAVHEKTDVVLAVVDYIVDQFHKGVIWLPLDLAPYLSLPALKDSRFRKLEVWQMWLSWLLEVQTEIAKQDGRYPPELRDASEKEMRKINELTFDIFVAQVPEHPRQTDREFMDLFEMTKRLVEETNIEPPDLTLPTIEWDGESDAIGNDDQKKVGDWFDALFHFLNENLELWLTLARKRVAEEEELVRASPKNRERIESELRRKWSEFDVRYRSAYYWMPQLRPDDDGVVQTNKQNQGLDKALAKLRSVTTEILDLRQRMRSMETREPEAKTFLGRRHRAKKRKEK